MKEAPGHVKDVLCRVKCIFNMQRSGTAHIAILHQRLFQSTRNTRMRGWRSKQQENQRSCPKWKLERRAGKVALKTRNHRLL